MYPKHSGPHTPCRTSSNTRLCGCHKEVYGMSSNSRGLPRPAPPSLGVTWGGVPFNARQVLTVAAATLVVAGLAGPATANAATPSASVAERASVIVRELPGAGNAAEKAVSALGGSVGRQLSIIGGF